MAGMMDKSSPTSTYGIALDVDGVLVRDSTVIPQALPALEMLQKYKDNIVTVFVTNGGSITEEAKAEQLSAKLGMPVSANQVILSHTPLRRLTEQYANKNILVIGGDSCMEVAKSYGFQQPICPSEYHRTHHSIYPSRPPQTPPSPTISTTSTSTEREGTGAGAGVGNRLAIDTRGDDLAAILVLGDSMDWGVDMQVMTDALLNHLKEEEEKEGRGRTLTHLPIFACNADIVYTGRHPNPRFTQGAFVHAFKSLFEHYSDIPLDIEYCGKPFPIQYEYAEELFRRNALAQGILPPSQCFGIGDNPKSDIRGANSAGSHWRSILVCTGVYQGGGGAGKNDKNNDNNDHDNNDNNNDNNNGNNGNDPQDPADFVVQDVLAAVQLLVAELERH